MSLNMKFLFFEGVPYSQTTQYFKIILRLLPDYSHFQMTIRLLLDYFKTNPRLLPILRLLSDHSIF